MRIFAFIMFALFLGAGPASAWEEYVYLDQGVAISFPAKPQAMQSTYDSILAKGLPSTIYSAEDDHVIYKLTVVDLTSHFRGRTRTARRLRPPSESTSAGPISPCRRVAMRPHAPASMPVFGS